MIVRDERMLTTPGPHTSEQPKASAAVPVTGWTRRAEPFCLYDHAEPAVPRAELPWAWIRPRRLLFLLDLLSAVLTVWTFEDLRGSLSFTSTLSDSALQAVRLSFGLTAVVLFVVMLLDRTYGTSDRLSFIDDGARLVRDTSLAGLVVLCVAMLGWVAGRGPSGEVLLATVALVAFFTLLLTSARVEMWWWQRRMFMRGHGLRRVVVLGAEKEARAFDEFLNERRWLGLRLVGGVRVLERQEDAALGGGRPVGSVLGGLSTLDEVLADADAHELVIALDERERVALPRLLRVLYHGRLPYSVMPAMFDRAYRLAPDAQIDGVPIFPTEFDPWRRIARWVKRGVDMWAAAAVIVVLSPVLAAAAIAVKLSSPGPVFFRQQRVGLGGRPFTMLKFRTMYADAERRLVEVAHLNQQHDGRLFKVADDPRITRAGSFLRRWSIDELPQAFNVVRGEMSLVGPRPPLPREVAAYEAGDCARLMGKPGITGLWQVSGRSDLTFEQMVALDRKYLEHWSLRLDLSIIRRTLGAVLRRHGAY